MGCKTKWDRAFMLKTFTLKFAKGDYKKHLEAYFIDREKALMPETQAKITRRLELDALRDEKNLLYSKITEVARQLKKIERSNTQAKSSSMIVSVDDLKKVMAELLAKIDAVNDALQDSPTNRRAAERKFIRACPSDCRGFLNTDWVCGLCSTHVCSKCHEIKAPGGSPSKTHKCLKTNVATAALLAKDTKPCPKCAAQIFKINGCDQMWCTQCKTGFSWQSGAIELVVHNPHYYEWQQKHGSLPRALGDVPCGGLIAYDHLEPLINRRCGFVLPADLYWFISLVHRNIQHHRQVTLGEHCATAFDPQDNEDLRLKYLNNEIDLAHLGQTVQQREARRERKQAVNNVVDMYATVAEDLFRNLAHGLEEAMRGWSKKNNEDNNERFDKVEKKRMKVIRKFHTEMMALRTYTLEQLESWGNSIGANHRK